ncbi:MAG: hypothetical protein M3Q73_01425 [bacterium]|nr:hypothetical protein [bacterium]
MLTFTTSLVLILSTVTSNSTAAVATSVANTAPIVETSVNSGLLNPNTSKLNANTVLTADHSKFEAASLATKQQEANRNKGVSVETYVRAYFAKTPILAEIAFCESRFIHMTVSGKPLQGRVVPEDTGVMQVNKTYHAATAAKMGLNLDKLDDNLAYGKYLYEKQGVQPWSASRPCWGKKLEPIALEPIKTIDPVETAVIAEIATAI